MYVLVTAAGGCDVYSVSEELASIVFSRERRVDVPDGEAFAVRAPIPCGRNGGEFRKLVDYGGRMIDVGSLRATTVEEFWLKAAAAGFAFGGDAS